MRRWTNNGGPAALALITALALAPLVAQAQPTVANATDADKERARTNYESAKEAYQAGRYDEALSGFEASYQSVASPNSQLMVARSLRGLQRDAEAYHRYQDTVSEAEQWGDGRYDDASNAAKKEMAELKPTLAMLRVEVGDPHGDAKLSLNGRAIERERWAEPLAAKPGETRVALEGEDGRTVEETLTLEAGVAAAIALTLPPPEPTPEPTPEPQVVVSTDGGGSGMRTAAYVAGGVGVAALGAFAVLGIMSQGEFDDLEEKCPSKMDCDPSLADTADSGKSLQTGANIALVVGAVGVAAGVVLFVLSADDGETRVSVGPGHVSLRGAL